jgi:rhodanese-related sulfurtransferase
MFIIDKKTVQTLVAVLSNATSEDNFYERYGRKKPDSQTSIIFMCRIGVRSQTAADLATQMGFTK